MKKHAATTNFTSQKSGNVEHYERCVHRPIMYITNDFLQQTVCLFFHNQWNPLDPAGIK